MSVLITMKFAGDVAKARQAFTERGDEMAKFGEMARAAGCLHHRFGAGDGFVLVVDEWDSAEQYQAFMSNPDLQAFIGTVGADPGPPEVTITEALATADEF